MKIPAKLLAGVTALLLGLLSAGCDHSDAVGAPGARAAEGDAICMQADVTDTLTAAQTQRMVAMRQKFFGADNVDAVSGAVRADRVIASWVDVTGYALAINGQVVLLDAFVGNLPADSAYSPTDDCELSDLRPKALFVGHGHFDHAQLVAAIANRNRGLAVVGTGELCADLAVAAEGHFTPNCITAIPLAAPVATQAEVPALLAGVSITALKHPHSGAALPEDVLHPPALPVPVYLKTSPLSPCASDSICPTPASPGFVSMSYEQDGTASLLYQFRYGDFVLTWNNTNGPNADGDAVITAMAALPQTDVELGSVLGFNVFTNGFIDARRIAEALRARLLVPGHHDFIGPYRAASYDAALAREFDNIPADRRTGIVFVSDPDDYLAHERTTFVPTDAVWADTAPLASR